MPLTLQASLIGRAATNGDRVQVTLKIGQDFLHLNLLPEDAVIFPELVAQEGGAHPTFDPRRIVYSAAPSYTVTIARVEVAPEPVEEALEAPEPEAQESLEEAV